MKPGADGADMPTWRASDGHGGPGPGHHLHDPRRRRGLPGVLKFILSTAILAVVVVVAALTAPALRPVVRAAVVGWAWDNPSSLRISFVADFIREDLEKDGVLDAPAGTDRGGLVGVLPGETPTTLAPVSVTTTSSSPASLPVHGHPGEAGRPPPGRLFILRRDMTPARS